MVRLKLDSESSWKDTGVVKSVDHDRRTCIIETDRGDVRRNRRHVQKTLQPESLTCTKPTETVLDVNDETETSTEANEYRRDSEVS